MFVKNVKIMNKSYRTGFVHSIKVPRLYKTAAVIARQVVEEGHSLKDLVYSSGHKNIKGVYALVVETIKHLEELEKLIKVSKLLENETRFQPWLAKILLTELFYGKKKLSGESKPVQTILSYKKQFERLMKNKNDSVKNFTPEVKKPRYVRVNTLQHTPDEIIKAFRNEGWNFLPPPTNYSEFLETVANLNSDSFTKDFHVKEILVFPHNVQFYENELYRNGSILLQDKASCLSAFLLKPTPNSVVLDMCAAPGMKTTHLAALMKNKGKLYATEVNNKRFKVLCDVVDNAGCSIVTPINIDVLKLNGEDPNFSWCKDVEYILVDPSCSGSGIIDRINIFSNEKCDSKRLKKLCGFQFKLLKHALTNFPKVKRVVYSTCSIHTVENENVVEDVLKALESENSQHKFQLAEPLKDSWPSRGADDFEHGKYCIFANPEKDLTNGFFIAIFERLTESSEVGGSTEEPEKKKRKKIGKNHKSENETDDLEEGHS